MDSNLKLWLKLKVNLKLFRLVGVGGGRKLVIMLAQLELSLAIIVEPKLITAKGYGMF